MNISEFAKELGVSEHYILHHFKKIYNSYKKRGIKLVKCGKGVSAKYGIIENGAVAARFEYKGD